MTDLSERVKRYEERCALHSHRFYESHLSREKIKELKTRAEVVCRLSSDEDFDILYAQMLIHEYNIQSRRER